MKTILLATGLAASLASASASRAAGEVATPQPAALSVELNALADAGPACRLTFVLKSDLPGTVEKTSFEFAFFDKTGKVERLTALNFGKLQKGRTSVRQFEVPGGACASYSRVLINAVKSCDGQPSVDVCEQALVTGNKTAIDFGR